MGKLLSVLLLVLVGCSSVSVDSVREDPLSAVQQQGKDVIEEKMALNPLKGWALHQLHFEFEALKVLRDFFSGNQDARKKLSVDNASLALPGVPYVIESKGLKPVYPSKQKGKRKASGSSIFSALKRAVGYKGKVVVFVPGKEALPLDLEYSSLGLLPRKTVGRDRNLRSKKYERFSVALKIDGDKVVVTECKKDETFDSEEYVLERTKERIRTLAYEVLSQKTLKSIASDLKLGLEGEINRTIDEISPNGDSALRWTLSASLTDDEDYEALPEPVTILLAYDWHKDVVEIKKCTRNAHEKAELEQQKRIADFVEKYLGSDSKTRAKMRLKPEGSDLPDSGKLFFKMNPNRVTKLGDNMWTAKCMIMHSTNFGFPEKNGVGRRAKFICKVKLNGDGQLQVIEDKCCIGVTR